MWKTAFLCPLLMSCYVTCIYVRSSVAVTTCLWHNNTCVDECPGDLIKVKSWCNQSFWESIPTCEEPEPALVATVCGSARCQCVDGNVLDTDTGFCFELENCPKKHDSLDKFT